MLQEISRNPDAYLMTPKVDGRQVAICHIDDGTFLCDRRGQGFHLHQPIWQKAFADIYIEGEMVQLADGSLAFVPFDLKTCYSQSIRDKTQQERLQMMENLFVNVQSTDFKVKSCLEESSYCISRRD
jgi:hypothetical protein